MQEENFSPQNSLRVIESMLQKTQQEIKGNDIYLLIWGWLTFICCTAQFLLKRVFDYPEHYRVWWLMFVGVLLSIIVSVREKRERKVKTYIDECLGYLWLGMGISFFVLSMILTRMGWNTTVFPFFILLYGLGTFISGCLLRFRPLIIGGILAWCIAMASVFIDTDYQMLAAGVAIMVSYVIPAYMLRAKYKTPHKK